MLDKRVSEVKALIDQLHKKDILNLIFPDLNPESGSLDLDNIIVSGHSMGGSTAMVVCDEDKRVRTVLTHDIWYQIIKERLPKFKSIFDKNVQTITSAQYFVENHFEDPFGSKFRNTFKNKDLFSSLVVSRTHHLQQTDCSVLLPHDLEIFLNVLVTSGITDLYPRYNLMAPPRKINGVFQLFITLWLKYLHDRGVRAPGTDFYNIVKTMKKYHSGDENELGYVSNTWDFQRDKYCR